jgi:hypothetical protein
MKLFATQRARLITVGLSTILFGWLSLGLYSDAESGNIYAFFKHRPSFHVYFRCPYPDSESDVRPLSDSEERAFAAFDEFVNDHGGYQRGMNVTDANLAVCLLTGLLYFGLCAFCWRALQSIGR